MMMPLMMGLAATVFAVCSFFLIVCFIVETIQKN